MKALDNKFNLFVVGFFLGMANCYMCYSFIQSKIDVRQMEDFTQIKSDIHDIKKSVTK